MREIKSKKEAIEKCIELIDTFNPITHSIDSHIYDAIGDTKKTNTPSLHLFIQQVVYGTQKEKPLLKKFINVFYLDNASSVSRADITLYTVLAYMLIFRLNEMKFSVFKEFASTQDPSIVCNILGYLFDKDWLWSTIRTELMKVCDLTFLENEIFASIEKYMPAAHSYIGALNADAAQIAAKQAEKEKAEAEGTAGLKTVETKPLTRPISPKLSKKRPPKLREPMEISGTITAKPVPSAINRRDLAMIEEEDKKRKEDIKNATISKYANAKGFKPREMKGGRSRLELAKELEDEKTRELQFNNSYYHPVPDFEKEPAKVRLNVASILREDYLFRKQQAKDVALLKNYEEELRDSTEYYIWKSDMEERDQLVKLRQVVERREEAKRSSEEAAIAFENMQSDNRVLAGMIREQGKVIAEKIELEKEVEVIKKQGTVYKISEVRDKAPGIAMKKVIEERVVQGIKVREELKIAAEVKAKEDKQYELDKADKIRQLRAENDVHREYIKVFDPTQVAGPLFLDQMSYMETKERQENVAKANKVKEQNKREDIEEAKQKRAKDLEKRTLSIKHLREIKSESNAKARANKLENQRLMEEKKRHIREQAAMKLRDELVGVRAEKAAERKALLDEQDRIKRQQQYMGASKGAVEENRNKELQMASERKIAKAQLDVRRQLIMDASVKEKNKRDKKKVTREEKIAKTQAEEESAREVLRDKRRAVEKLKADILRKKSMVKDGREQMERTRTVRVDHNPYAQRVNDEIHEKTIRIRETLAAQTSG